MEKKEQSSVGIETPEQTQNVNANGEKQCYIYIAGDVLGYSMIRYQLAEKSRMSFFSAHALARMLNIKSVYALLPDSLLSDGGSFSEDLLIKGYKNMILSRLDELHKSGSVDDSTRKEIEEFVSSIKVYVIPNLGSGQSYHVNEEGELERISAGGTGFRRVQYQANRSPIFLFNVVYSIFEDLKRKGYEEFFVDLTHGTNVLVSVVLAVGALFNARFFTAPIMGRPDGSVNVVELTDLVGAFRDSYAISLSVQNADERYFKDYIERLGDLNPNNYPKEKDLLKRLKKSDVNSVRSLLEDLRNGLNVSALRDMENVKKDFAKIQSDVEQLRDFYIKWYEHRSLENVSSIVISSIYSTLEAKKLLLEGNDIERLQKILELYKDLRYYGNALSLAHELVTVMCMNKKGGGEFDKNRQNKTYQQCSSSEIRDAINSTSSDLFKYRDILMHAELSEDVKTSVHDNKVENAQPVDFKNIKDYVENKLSDKFIEILQKLGIS